MTATKGRRGWLRTRNSTSDLLGQQAAGGAGQSLRRSNDGSVFPVGSTECIVDVQVMTCDQSDTNVGSLPSHPD